MLDQHQADVAATEDYKGTVSETLRALAARLTQIAEVAEGDNSTFEAFFGDDAPAIPPQDERDANAIKAADEAIRLGWTEWANKPTSRQ